MIGGQRDVDGPRAVETRVRALGIDHVTIRYAERDLQTRKVDNAATPAAMVALLVKVARRESGLSAASAALLDDVLLRVTTGQQRIKGALPPGTRVAHKAGMSDTRDGKTDAPNDVGLITCWMDAASRGRSSSTPRPRISRRASARSRVWPTSRTTPSRTPPADHRPARLLCAILT